MINAAMRRFSRGRVALALPLVGLVVFWVLVILGAYFELTVQYGGTYYNHPVRQQNAFHVATYLWLVGLGVLGLGSVTARRLTHSGGENRLENAVRGFSLVSVFVTLIVAAIWGISLFLSNFARNWYYGPGSAPRPDELMRVINVYAPIVLDAALIVFVILWSFVGLKDDSDEEVQND